MKVTYEQIKALNPCYPDSDLEALLPIGKEVEVTEKTLLSLSLPHCRWLFARLLNEEQKVEWAENCAERASAYENTNNTKTHYINLADRFTSKGIEKIEILAGFVANIAARCYNDDSAALAEHILAVKDALRLLN